MRRRRQAAAQIMTTNSVIGYLSSTGSDLWQRGMQVEVYTSVQGPVQGRLYTSATLVNSDDGQTMEICNRDDHTLMLNNYTCPNVSGFSGAGCSTATCSFTVPFDLPLGNYHVESLWNDCTNADQASCFYASDMLVIGFSPQFVPGDSPPAALLQPTASQPSETAIPTANLAALLSSSSITVSESSLLLSTVSKVAANSSATVISYSSTMKGSTLSTTLSAAAAVAENDTNGSGSPIQQLFTDFPKAVQDPKIASFLGLVCVLVIAIIIACVFSVRKSRKARRNAVPSKSAVGNSRGELDMETKSMLENGLEDKDKSLDPSNTEIQPNYPSVRYSGVPSVGNGAWDEINQTLEDAAPVQGWSRRSSFWSSGWGSFGRMRSLPRSLGSASKNNRQTSFIIPDGFDATTVADTESRRSADIYSFYDDEDDDDESSRQGGVVIGAGSNSRVLQAREELRRSDNKPGYPRLVGISSYKDWGRLSTATSTHAPSVSTNYNSIARRLPVTGQLLAESALTQQLRPLRPLPQSVIKAGGHNASANSARAHLARQNQYSDQKVILGPMTDQQMQQQQRQLQPRLPQKADEGTGVETLHRAERKADELVHNLAMSSEGEAYRTIGGVKASRKRRISVYTDYHSSHFGTFKTDS